MCAGSRLCQVSLPHVTGLYRQPAARLSCRATLVPYSPMRFASDHPPTEIARYCLLCVAYSWKWSEEVVEFEILETLSTKPQLAARGIVTDRLDCTTCEIIILHHKATKKLWDTVYLCLVSTHLSAPAAPATPHRTMAPRSTSPRRARAGKVAISEAPPDSD